MKTCFCIKSAGLGFDLEILSKVEACLDGSKQKLKDPASTGLRKVFGTKRSKV